MTMRGRLTNLVFVEDNIHWQPEMVTQMTTFTIWHQQSWTSLHYQDKQAGEKLKELKGLYKIIINALAPNSYLPLHYQNDMHNLPGTLYRSGNIYIWATRTL